MTTKGSLHEQRLKCSGCGGENFRVVQVVDLDGLGNDERLAECVGCGKRRRNL